MKNPRSVAWLLLPVSLVLLAGCANRAASGDYGHAEPFHDTNAGYRAAHSVAGALYIYLPVDLRNSYYGVAVAGTTWAGCRTDTYEESQEPVVPQLLWSQLRRDVEAAKLFSRVADSANEADYTLTIEIHAFCSQARGLTRVAGVIALKLTLKHGDQVLLEKVYESVITDADKEYTGSSTTQAEQAMRVLLSDTLRHVYRDALKDIDGALASS
jgi:hypothetical protein